MRSSSAGKGHRRAKAGAGPREQRPPDRLPRVIGHRGAAGHAPENTLAAIRAAAALGVAWVEVDTMLTRDGHVILFHDDALKRITGAAGLTAATDLARFRRLEAGAWYGRTFKGEPVPTLEEAIAVLAELGLGANVEVKPTPGREAETGRAVARVLAGTWPARLPPPLLSSFKAESLGAARDAAPDIERALLVLKVPRDFRARLGGLGCTALHCRHEDLTSPRARAVVRAGFFLRCFTVNEPLRAKALYAWGVDGVFSDYPDRLLST